MSKMGKIQQQQRQSSNIHETTDGMKMLLLPEADKTET
jgi:hypothetical protein